jgi:hypothetical protein
MPDLRTQLAKYLEHVVEHVEFDDIVSPKLSSPQRAPSESKRISSLGLPRWLAAVALALFVAGVGGINLLSQSQQGTSPEPGVVSSPTPNGLQNSVGDFYLFDGSRQTMTVDGVTFSVRGAGVGWETYPQGEDTFLVSKSTSGPQGAEAMIFWAGFPDGTQADPCPRWGPWPSESSASAAYFVASSPGVELLSGPSEVTIGGFPAQHVIVIVREDTGCDPGFFYNWKAQTVGAMWDASLLGDTIRVWIVDVNGTLLFIAGETHPSPGSHVVEELQEIVESIVFD